MRTSTCLGKFFDLLGTLRHATVTRITRVQFLDSDTVIKNNPRNHLVKLDYFNIIAVLGNVVVEISTSVGGVVAINQSTDRSILQALFKLQDWCLTAVNNLGVKLCIPAPLFILILVVFLQGQIHISHMDSILVCLKNWVPPTTPGLIIMFLHENHVSWVKKPGGRPWLPPRCGRLSDWDISVLHPVSSKSFQFSTEIYRNIIVIITYNTV